MDPFTILAAAKASFEAIKAGIAVGKEIQSMAGDLSSLFESVAHLTRASSEPQRPGLLSGKSAEQLAIEAYSARAEADAMLQEIKNAFVSEHGIGAWDVIVAETTKIKKQQKAAALQAAKEQEELIGNIMSFVVGAGIFLVSLFAIGALVVFSLTR